MSTPNNNNDSSNKNDNYGGSAGTEPFGPALPPNFRPGGPDGSNSAPTSLPAPEAKLIARILAGARLIEKMLVTTQVVVADSTEAADRAAALANLEGDLWSDCLSWDDKTERLRAYRAGVAARCERFRAEGGEVGACFDEHMAKLMGTL